MTVLDWGDTDSDTPREVVDVILQLGPEAIQSVATVLAAWIVARKGRGAGTRDRAIRGIVITAPDESRVELSLRKPVSRREATEIVSSFLRSKASAGQREAN